MPSPYIRDKGKELELYLHISHMTLVSVFWVVVVPATL